MSGPKISIYTLNGAQRKIVLAQLQCDRETLSCLAEVRETLDNALAIYEAIVPLLSDLDMLAKRGVGDPVKQERLKRLGKDIDEDTARKLESYRVRATHLAPRTPGRMSVRESDLKRKQDEVKAAEKLRSEVEGFLENTGLSTIARENLTAGQSEDLLHSIIDDLGTANTAAHEEKIRVEAVANMTFADIVADIAASPSFDGAFDDGAAEALLSRKHEIRDRLLVAGVGADPVQRDEANGVREAVDAITDINYLNTFESITVLPLLKRIADATRHAGELTRAFKSEYARYRSLCVIAQSEPQEIPVSDEGLASVRTAIAALEAELVHREEQHYIAHTIDEVMVEMGYDVIGHREVTKKSGSRFQNRLYDFGEGTGLNVTFSSDGQIAMELGGIDTSDHIPTTDESLLLQEEMVAFCDSYATIEEKLRERNILVGTRVSLAPPSADYATIININDYELDSTRQVSMITAGKKRKRSTGQKTLRRDSD